jgi:hypothetical protein
MDRAILGLYPDADSAAEATGALKDAGFTGRDYDILSSTPYPSGAFGEEVGPIKLYVFPLVGALCGFIVGIAVTLGTQLANPLVTGGKPILAIPPSIVILYEGTMLGAIIFTVIGVLFESRLPNLGLSVYDTRITEGYIGVLIPGTDEQVSTAENVFRETGAVDIHRDDEDGSDEE